MSESSSQNDSSGQTSVGGEALPHFRPLGRALLPALFWLPWNGASSAINAVGCVMAFVVLKRLVEADERFAAAKKWFILGAVLYLADAVYELAFGPFALFHLHGHAVRLPVTLHLGDFMAGMGLWRIASALMDMASAGRDIELRNVIGTRLDFYLVYLVLVGLTMGPALVAAHRFWIGWLPFQAAFVGVGVFKLIVMALWAKILSRCSEGFESHDILL